MTANPSAPAAMPSVEDVARSLTEGAPGASPQKDAPGEPQREP